MSDCEEIRQGILAGLSISAYETENGHVKTVVAELGLVVKSFHHIAMNTTRLESRHHVSLNDILVELRYGQLEQVDHTYLYPNTSSKSNKWSYVSNRRRIIITPLQSIKTETSRKNT